VGATLVEKEHNAYRRADDKVRLQNLCIMGPEGAPGGQTKHITFRTVRRNFAIGTVESAAATFQCGWGKSKVRTFQSHGKQLPPT
jgi:hypothetical protein